jgi:hypothetical protein
MVASTYSRRRPEDARRRPEADSKGRVRFVKVRFRPRILAWSAVAALMLLVFAAVAFAAEGPKKFRLQDDCEAASFNAVLGAGACVGNGHTTFDEFIAELEATQDARDWRNAPSTARLKAGRPTKVENVGGEVHTFTRVASFGGGFVNELNGISGNPVPAPECLNIGSLVFIPAGGVVQGPTAGSSELPVGASRFQCCIHPWMRSEIDVFGK